MASHAITMLRFALAWVVIQDSELPLVEIRFCQLNTKKECARDICHDFLWVLEMANECKLNRT